MRFTGTVGNTLLWVGVGLLVMVAVNWLASEPVGFFDFG